jgi:hypothetical protein
MTVDVAMVAVNRQLEHGSIEVREIKHEPRGRGGASNVGQRHEGVFRVATSNVASDHDADGAKETGRPWSGVGVLGAGRSAGGLTLTVVVPVEAYA